MKNNAKILVIDNNKSIISKIEKQFSNHAVIKVVKTLDNGKDALDYILNNQNDFDIIVMDLILPEIDGLTILQQMKDHNIDKKIIVITMELVTIC